MKNFLSLKKMFLILSFTLFAFILDTPNVYAAGEHELSIKAVVCDSERYSNSDDSTNANNCYSDYEEGLDADDFENIMALI